MTAALHARVRQMSERALIRAWEYRQRNLSKGVWFRLRRVLTDASRAFVVTAEQANQLESMGCHPLPIGEELEPKKRIFMLHEQQLANSSAYRRVPVRLSREILDAPNLVLVSFVSDGSPAIAGRG
jgi:hypothetical protein